MSFISPGSAILNSFGVGNELSFLSLSLLLKYNRLHRSMYPHYGDSQYPNGPELDPMHSQMPVDPSLSSRYPYMPPYYGSKAPENSQLAAAMAAHGRPHYGGEYGVMSNPEGVYNQAWVPPQNYVGAHVAKPSPYGMQVGNNSES